MKMTLGETETVPIDKVKPYWRNPRRITDENVNVLAESIRHYGYQQPLVVDDEYVLIVGHTRYAALRRLDVDEVQVVVARDLSPQQVKQYRLIDNRAGEYSSWQFDKLADELDALDRKQAELFFPEMMGVHTPDFEMDSGRITEMWEKATGNESVDTTAEFICPSCFHRWEHEVKETEIMLGKIEEKGSADGGAA